MHANLTFPETKNALQLPAATILASPSSTKAATRSDSVAETVEGDGVYCPGEIVEVSDIVELVLVYVVEARIGLLVEAVRRWTGGQSGCVAQRIMQASACPSFILEIYSLPFVTRGWVDL